MSGVRMRCDGSDVPRVRLRLWIPVHVVPCMFSVQVSVPPTARYPFDDSPESPRKPLRRTIRETLRPNAASECPISSYASLTVRPGASVSDNNTRESACLTPYHPVNPRVSYSPQRSISWTPSSWTQPCEYSGQYDERRGLPLGKSAAFQRFRQTTGFRRATAGMQGPHVAG